MKKRVLLIVLAMVLVAALSVGLTLAYLTSTAEATNTFTVGKVNITMDEAKVDEYGVPVAGADRVETNEYKLIPGHTYVKDPTVTVAADSESAYIRMIVKVSDYQDLIDALKGKKADNGFDCVVNNGTKDIVLLQNLVSGWNPEKWVTTNVVKVENDIATYEFRYFEPVSTADTVALKLDALFGSFTFPSAVIGTDLNELEELEIKVEAHAIQADGFNGNENEAWAKFDVQQN